MKTRPLVILLISILCFWSCAGKSVIPTYPGHFGDIDPLFSRAEKHFRYNRNKEALQLYNQYLSQYPGGPMAPAALLKIGTIFMALEDYSAARRAYQRLIKYYPNSSLVTDAKIDLLRALYFEGRHAEVIHETETMQKMIPARHHRIRILILQGDAYLAAGALAEACFSYSKAYQRAHRIEKREVLKKLDTALSMMDSKAIASITENMNTPALQALLLYRLGLKYADEGQYHLALTVLSQFIDQFPRHEHAPDATHLLRDLETQSQYDHFTIGCMLPLSGPYKIFGNNALKGIELALAHFDRSDIHPDFNILVKDTQSDPEKAIRAVKELADQGAAAIIGPIITAKAAAVEAENQGIPIITLTQKADIADIGPFVFRNFLTPQMQIETLVSFAVENLGLNRFAMLYPDENYGHTFGDLFAKEVARHGGTLTNAEMYQSDQTDFSKQIKKLIKETPASDIASGRSLTPADTPKPTIDFEALFIPDAPSKTGLIIPQLVYHDITDAYLLGTNLWYSGTLIEMAEKHCRGAILPNGFFAESHSPRVRKFIRDFEENYHEKPDFLVAVSYDSAVMLLDILSRSRFRFRSELNAALLNLKNFEGVTGPTSFKPNGDAEKQLYLLQIRDNSFIELPRASNGMDTADQGCSN